MTSPRQSRARRTRLTALTVAAAVILTLVSSVLTAGPAVAASTLGVEKTASVSTTQPGQDFQYTLVPRCSGLTEACINATVVDIVPAGIEVTALPPSNADRLVTFDTTTRELRIVYRIPLPPPSPAGSVGLPAGSSNNVQVGVRVPEGSAVTDGTVITNTVSVSADNAPPATDSAEVTVDVPRVVRPVATKTWLDGSAVAGSGEASVIRLGVRNASSTTAEVSALTVEDATPEVFDRFDVTGIGPVTFPPGADRVTVLACTEILSDCADADYTASAAQSGPGLTLPAGIQPADVTGLRFVFTSAAGTAIPPSPDPGTVVVNLVLRDTLRSTGATYSPTTRDVVDNCVTPSGDDPVLGDVSGTEVCAQYAVQPAQATMSLDKTFFSDTDANYVANGQAVEGENSLVSGLVAATNTSPFPVSQVTITDPSTTPPGEFDKIDVTNVRVIFPAGASTAEVSFDCGAGGTITRQLVPPPSTQDLPVPCLTGRTEGVTVTFSGTDPDGNATIAAGAVATLGIQGRLNDNVTADDLVGGGSAGVQNCASGTATSSINGVGSAAAADCASVAVQPAFSRVQGVKTSELPTILPGLPRTFTLSFTNNGTVPATGVTLADPADPTAPGNIFDSVRLTQLTLPATPAAVAEVYDPLVDAYVPYDASATALLLRARGFRVTLTEPLGVRQTYRLTARVVLRDGVEAGTRLQNCASVGSDTQPATSFCAPAITATEPSEGASIQKSISPATSVRPRPGLPGTPMQVKLAAQNTGTLWLKRLVVTDIDPDFFDAVDVTGSVRVNFPPSSNRVQVDVCTTDCAGGTFINGTRTANQSPPLPAGVAAADVRGFRITFSVADDSFTIKPGTNFPSSGLCTGASVCIGAIPRATLHSDPGTTVPDVLVDTASGGYESTRQGGALAPIPNTTATHELTAGTAQLRFDKSADIAAGPGEPIPFTLTLTNTGTGPLPDPSITEPLPSRLDFSPSNPLAPYTYEITQPTGAPASPEPSFTTTDDGAGRVRALRWDFEGLVLLPGGSITVTVQTQLAPGVTAGSTIENRAGGTADRPGLSCADGGSRPGTATDDPAYGDGLYCTSGAVVTTLAGNAVAAAKWVSGDTSLGWLNSVTGEFYDVGDPACPRLTVDGESFTRYPCVARVAPGQGFDFYVRVTNAGTNPATEIRVVDVFPAPGDTGVILTGEERGTRWDQPPTLLGPVALSGAGNLDASYSTVTPTCTLDLNRPPGTCAPDDWSATYDPQSSAFRGIITFPGGLGPGDATALRFRMAAPAAPTNAVQNEVAWNSFAHTEFFSDSGRIVQLPATEPIKTGVATVFGDITTAKVVVGDADAGPFGFAYRCTVTPETGAGPGDPVEVAAGAFEIRGGEELTLTTVPARATCRVWETDSAGLVGDAEGEANAKSVTVPVGGLEGVPRVTITNRAAPTTSPPVSPSTSPSSEPSNGPSQESPGTGPSASPPAGTMPDTGASRSLVPLGTAGALLLLAGVGFLVVAQRRRREH
ncbi:DUF5979 domain-containing protein [Nocardioides sp.]|uniref:DUF5979 domain-containing protein n=1 Tax=Nocardioides sp. TaxID=35761 RepID=UPI003D128C18